MFERIFFNNANPSSCSKFIDTLEELGLLNYKPKYSLTFQTTKKKLHKPKDLIGTILFTKDGTIGISYVLKK